MFASNLECAGLYTFPNNLSKVPVGSLSQADNLVINRDGVAESRRGLATVGTTLSIASTSDWINQYFAYQNRLLVNDTTGKLFYDSDGALTWTAFSGTFLPPTGADRMRGVEANKNFYFTTSLGIYKSDAYNAQPVLAGTSPALDGSAALAGAAAGFLGAAKQCVYQIVFGYLDANGNLILGSPSQRILAVNSTGTPDNAKVTFTLPSGLTTSYFYQVYRTVQTDYSATPSLNVPPGAEPQLATQQTLTAGNIIAGSVTYTDITTDDLLGAYLYTNPSQDGALQSNDRPPLCLDFCLFNQMMLYANCMTLASLDLSVISVGAPDGIIVNDTLTITVNAVTTTFTAKATQNNAAQEFAVVATGTVAENIDATTRNLVACLNANVSLTGVYAYYVSGYNDLPGQMLLQAATFSVTEFVVGATHGTAYSTPYGVSSAFSVSGTSESFPNGLYISKVDQPEAVPLVNLLSIGGGDQPILRVKPLRDRVVVIKTDGIYTVTGYTPETLVVTLLDSSIICIAPESVALLNNSAYCMTNQGVVTITESGVSIQSRPIEYDLLQLTSPSYTYFKQCCVGISYESERLYILTMPTNTGDTYGTQAYCFNWVTNAWTRWPIDISAGLVNPYDNILYLGRPAANHTYAYKERKNFAYADFKDDAFSVTIVSVDATGLVVTIAGTPSSSWVGDALAQTDSGTATITAVDTVAKTITVDIDDSSQPGTAISWIAGSAEVQVPIPLDLMWCPITAGYPHVMKNWGRCNFWFNGGNFQRITAGFQTDLTGPTQTLAAIITGLYGFGSFGGGSFGGTVNNLQSIQTLAPMDNGQARWIQPSLSISFPEVRFSCLGVTLGYEVISDTSG